MRACLFVVIAAGCGRVAFDPLVDSGGVTGGDSSMLVCPDVPSCPDRSAPVGIGMSTVSAPVQINHGLSATACGGNGNPELAVMFRPQAGGRYTIEVSPSTVATYVQDGCCGGTELSCGQNPVTLQRNRGQDFVVVIEALPSTQVSVKVTGN